MAGAKLPPTYQEAEARELAADKAQRYQHEKNSLDNFLNLPKFSVVLLDMILILWLLCNCIP